MKIYVILIITIVIATFAEVKFLKSLENRIQSKKLTTVKQLSNHKYHKHNRYHDYRKRSNSRKRHRRWVCICVRRPTTASPISVTSVTEPIVVIPPSEARNRNLLAANVNSTRAVVIPPSVTDGSQPIVVIQPTVTTSSVPRTTTLGPVQIECQFCNGYCQQVLGFPGGACNAANKCFCTPS